MRYRLLILIYSCLFPIFICSTEQKPREDLFLSTPEEVASLTAESNDLVGGIISPLSGQPVLRQTDLVVKGAQCITLSRTYLSPHIPVFIENKHNPAEYNKKYFYHYLNDHYKGWQFYPHLRLELDSKLKQVRVSDPNGMTLEFCLSGRNCSVATLTTPPYAMSNVSGEEPSGKYDPRNTRITYEESGKKITVHGADGTARIYLKKGKYPRHTYLYQLEKEVLPNGKVLRYRYNEYNQLQSIESLDPQERYVYASLSLTGTAWHGQCHFTSSSGLTTDYTYQTRPFQWKIKEKIKGHKLSESCNLSSPPILTTVSSPSYRQESLSYSEQFLLNSYSGKEEIFKTEHEPFGEEAKYYKVQKLLLPVGPDDAFIPVYEFAYQPPVAGQKAGITTVTNREGTTLVYHFSKKLLTTLIQSFDQKGTLKKEKVFSWNKKNWLESLEIRDGQKKRLYHKSYQYDRYGNPILEVFTGDLTGNGSEESFTTHRIFSQDGKNLLLREETDAGKILCFSYLPSTHLVTAKLTKNRDQILLREFFIYDDCHNLIQALSDDGSSEDKDNLSDVAERKITTYTLRQCPPFLHMPEWIEETYLEKGIEKPLKKSHLIYDSQGNVAQEEVYDAEGKLAYTLYKTYNERGDVLSETNCLGQEATYTYDARGLLETSVNFSHKLHTQRQYDTKGRLKAQIEKSSEGVIHKTSAEYDFLDRKIEKKDFLENATHYTYDPLVNKVIKTDFPSLETPIATLSTYDPFGRELTRTDANGNTTTYCYNAYGSPVEIHYPNGSHETFRYTTQGWLATHTDRDGLCLDFSYDSLGRVLSKTYHLDKELATESFTYKGNNLITETDREGDVKTFSYDGAGRKVREDFCGHITDFGYDPLGWHSTICKHNGPNTLFIHYTRDLEGRILEERKTDSFGDLLYQIRYTYDPDGNQDSVIRSINGKESQTTFAYDAFHRQVESRDASGFLSKTTYHENSTNVFGQRVLQTCITDPHQITRVETQDTLGRTIRKEVFNPQGALISCQELDLDPQGNLLYQRDHCYENSQFKGIQTLKYTYTSDHLVASLTRAFGEKDSRTHSYTYSPSGKMVTKTLPDGITLTYRYHPLGFMSHLASSDDKIHHSFKYDKRGFLLSAIDEKVNIAIQRTLDPFGNSLEESFPSGITVKKDFDAFNRLNGLKINQVGGVLYSYDPLFLRKVTRTSPKDRALYSHTYEEYDLDGNLVAEQLIHNLGQVVYTTHPQGLKASISSPFFFKTVNTMPSPISLALQSIKQLSAILTTISLNSHQKPVTYMPTILFITAFKKTTKLLRLTLSTSCSH